MKQLIYTSKLLADLGACDTAAQWAAGNLAEGTAVTRELLESVPDPLWVWWLACRLDTKHELVWLAPNIAFREAAKTNLELAEWVGKITADNWKLAADAALAASAAVAAARAAARAAGRAEAVAAAWGAWAAAEAAARAAGRAEAVAADVRGAIQTELKQAAIEWLVKNQYIV